MYSIFTNGKWHHYATLAEAKEVANSIYYVTGIVVGIERRPDPYERHWQRNRSFNRGKASLID